MGEQSLDTKAHAGTAPRGFDMKPILIAGGVTIAAIAAVTLFSELAQQAANADASADAAPTTGDITHETTKEDFDDGGCPNNGGGPHLPRKRGLYGILTRKHRGYIDCAHNCGWGYYL